MVRSGKRSDRQPVDIDYDTYAKAEAELFERFHELAKGRMAILISHRLSTVKMVDRICVVDEGRIVEEGTHDVLMQKQGLYAKLFLTQAQHYQ